MKGFERVNLESVTVIFSIWESNPNMTMVHFIAIDPFVVIGT